MKSFLVLKHSDGEYAAVIGYTRYLEYAHRFTDTNDLIQWMFNESRHSFRLCEIVKVEEVTIPVLKETPIL